MNDTELCVGYFLSGNNSTQTATVVVALTAAVVAVMALDAAPVGGGDHGDEQPTANRRQPQ